VEQNTKKIVLTKRLTDRFGARNGFGFKGLKMNSSAEMGRWMGGNRGSVAGALEQIVAQFEFLSELCAGSLRPRRLKALFSSENQDTLVAEFAEKF
jgi:hypothetical protein